ncbi:hypothetical protein [Micromonospora robiginosa]|uniref:Uncharacterized protein n=1 Tax=Micromonospora robiginosa TaxID=2749844 RepID=A0A7L6B7P8_9ACTN|nr:hypothetical protein [Micromonospora ferruginea]QLQ37977.1 hypothetical protein H1D33_03535 [Micromonospora ferruginea]
MTATIEARTIDGTVYLSAPDLVALLRGRANEVKAVALAMGDDLTPEQYETAVAYHTTVEELRQRADWIDLAVIAHLTDEPGDSPT